MKIVLLDKEESQKIGGISVYTQRLYQHLISFRHQVSILRFTKKPTKEKNVYHIPYYLAEPRSFIVIPSEKALQIIRNHLAKIRPDLVYTCIGLSPLDFLLPWLCHDLKIPIAGVWHADFNYNPGAYQLLVKSVFVAYLPFCKQLDLLHVFSTKLAEFYINYGVAKKRVLVLPNGVDEKFYAPGASLFGKRRDVKTGILFLGRLTLQKNPTILIKSFLNLSPPPQTKLVLVGHGDQAATLQESYRDKRVIFTGVVLDEQRKLDIMRSCQIFVLPSRFEGMSLALLEAMSCGLACIASDAGSNKELLNKVGIVIPVARIGEELPLALRLCLENPEFVSLLGKKARQKIQKVYSQEIIFNQLIKAFETTISDYRKRGSPQTRPWPIDLKIDQKLRSVWQKAKKLSSYFEI